MSKSPAQYAPWSEDPDPPEPQVKGKPPKVPPPKAASSSNVDCSGNSGIEDRPA
jgi:hypothetical protein